MGVKFKSDTYGYVTGIRFYKASTNTGTHIGNLWTATGQLLASATFTGEIGLRLAAGELRAAGGAEQEHHLRRVLLRAQGALLAGRRVLLHDSRRWGRTHLTNVDSPPLHALRNTNGVVNGVYSYSGSSTFPTSSVNAANYWVDPVFTPETFTTPPGQVGNVSATAGYASATVTWSAPTSGDPVTTYTVTPYIGSAAQTPTTVTGNPAPTSAVVSGLTNGTTYTFTVTASNPAGTGPESAPSNAVTPSASVAACRQRRLRERPDRVDDRWRGPADRQQHPVPLRQQLRPARHGPAGAPHPPETATSPRRSLSPRRARRP